METLEYFVQRLSQSCGFYYQLIPSGTWYSLKKYEFLSQRRKNVFGWVKELKRRDLFLIDIFIELTNDDNIKQLEGEIKDKINYGKPGIIFYVKRGSNGHDYKEVVTALKAVMELI